MESPAAERRRHEDVHPPGGLAGPPAPQVGPTRLDVFATGPGNTVWRWAMTGSSGAPPYRWPRSGLDSGNRSVSGVLGTGRVEVFAADRNAAGLCGGAGRRGRRGLQRWEPAPARTCPRSGACRLRNVAGQHGRVRSRGRQRAVVVALGRGQLWSRRLRCAGRARPSRRAAGCGLPSTRGARHLRGRRSNTTCGIGARSPDRPGGWHTAEDLGGNMPMGAVSAVSWGANRVDVFAASANPGSSVQHWWSDGGGFSSDRLPAPPGDVDDRGIVAGTVAAARSAWRLDVVGVTGDQRIAHWQWDGRSWAARTTTATGMPAGL